MEKESGIDLKTVQKKSLSGIITLIFRTFFLQVLSLGATFLLTVFLEPKVFGIFFLVSAFVSFFTYFSDIGLAAALIQKEKIDEDDLKTTFAVQEGLVIILILVIFWVSPLASKWYGLSAEGQELIYALAISLFLSSLKTVPSILLERKLEFNRLVIPQVVENVVFYLVAVLLAWKNFGIKSFTLAVLARGVSGLAVIWLIAPWKIKIGFRKESLQRLLRFGLPYQINTFLAVAKDDLMTVFLGKAIGAQGLGYLGWAKKWAEQPLRFLMDNVLKVTFPAYARIQKDKACLGRAVEKSIFFMTFLTFPALAGFSVVAPELIKIIPRYQKWTPAIIPLYLYCLNSAWAVVSTSLTNLFNAVGKIKTTFKLMLMWFFLTWLLMPIMALRFGYLGVSLAAGIISFSSIVPLILVRKEVSFSLINSIVKPLLASLMMSFIMIILKGKFPANFSGIFLTVILGSLSYLLFSYILIGSDLFKDLKKFYYGIKIRNI